MDQKRNFSRYRVLLGENNSFRNLWLSQTLSYTGNSVYDITLMWFVFSKTGSAMQVSLIMIASFLPEVLFGMFLGALVDRWNQKRIMQFCDGMQALVLLMLAWSFYSDTFQMWQLYVVTVCLSLLGLFFSTAQAAWLPQMVAEEQLMTAYSLMTMSRQITRLLGSALGGVLVAFIGSTTAVAYDAFTFLLSLVFVQFIPYLVGKNESGNSVEKRTIFAEMGEGLRWLGGQRVLLLMVILGTLSNIALGPTNVLPAVYIQKELHGDASALGVFDGAIGLGILLASLLVGYLSPKRVGNWYVAGFLLQGVSMIVVAYAPNLLLACVGNFLLGVAVIVASLPMSTLFQLLIPSDKRGRVNSISSLGFNLAIPITYGGIGMLASGVGSRSTYAMGAALMVICGTIGYLSSSLRSADLRQRKTLSHQA